MNPRDDEGGCLTDRELAALRLERDWMHRHQHDGRKENAIRDLGATPTGHYMMLNQLVQSPRAWQAAGGEWVSVLRVVSDRIEHSRRQRPGRPR